MTTESPGFRDRLLGAQAMTPALREEYRKELDRLLNYRLTPKSRLLTWAGLLGSLGFAGLCVRALVFYHPKPGARILQATFAAVFVMVAAWLGQVLRRGGFARRSSFVVIEWLGGIFVGAYVAVALLQGMRAPADPASTLWAVWAVLLVMVGFAWGTGNRIAAATLETREHLLRVESRLADLAERLPKKM